MAFQFSVRASSAANAFCEMTVQVTVRMPDGPRFSRASYSFDVACGAPMRCLGRVMAATGGVNGNIRYSVPTDA